LICHVWPLVLDYTNTNGHPRQINDRGNDARSWLCN